MRFEDITETEELKNYLDNASNIKCRYLYHFTRVSSLVNIYQNATFKTNYIRNMNDKLEIQYAYNDSDRFACFNGSSIESFGMWSMYGGIGSYVGDIVDRTPNDAYVKISIPFSSIKKLVKDDNSISIRKIGYANINDLLLDRKRQLGTIYCGSCNNHKSDSRNINIRDRILSGYIKDYVWKYENEIRLVTKNEFINIEPIINDFEVIPSPSSSVQECNAIFYRLSENLEMKAVPKFVNNKYKDVVIIK